MKPIYNPFIKIINSILVIVILFLFPNQNDLLNILIFLGQAHFFLTYLYQYKNKKINRNYLIKFTVFFFILLAFYFIFLNGIFLIKFTSGLFVFHFLLDEFYLDNNELNKAQVFKILPILFSYLVFIFNDCFEEIYIFKILAIMSLLYFLFLTVVKNKMFMLNDVYLVFYSLVIVSSIFSNWLLIKENSMFFIVVLHYFNWYSYNYFKLRNNIIILKKYIVNVLLVNAVTGVLFIDYFFIGIGLPFLFLFFSPTFFYLWTLMHLFVTFRFNDIKVLNLKNHVED